MAARTAILCKRTQKEHDSDLMKKWGSKLAACYATQPETSPDFAAYVFDQAKTDAATNEALREHVAAIHSPTTDTA